MSITDVLDGAFQYLRKVTVRCTVLVQCLYSICTVFIRCSPVVRPLSVQCSPVVRACPCSVHSLFGPARKVFVVRGSGGLRCPLAIIVSTQGKPDKRDTIHKADRVRGAELPLQCHSLALVMVYLASTTVLSSHLVSAKAQSPKWLTH